MTAIDDHVIPIVCLPQQDLASSARARDLEEQRRRFLFLDPDDEGHVLAPMAVAGRAPLRSSYGPSWVLPYLPTLAKAAFGTLARGLRQRVRSRVRGEATDYIALAGGWGASNVTAEHHALDDAFAYARVSGPSPRVLERVDSVDELHRRIPLSDAELSAALGRETTLSEAIGAQRLFVADYRAVALAHRHGFIRDLRWRARYLAAPVALFYEADPPKGLQPVAIQTDQRASGEPDPPRMFPNDGNGWALAKLYVQNADVNLGVLGHHLGAVHGVAEAFAVSVPRQLSRRHPVHVLLEPHLAYTLAVNRAALGLLRTPGSVFEQVYSGSLPVTRQIMIDAHLSEGFRVASLEADLTRRGVGERPLDYPFRDDARLYPPVIARFVERYLACFYRDDRAVGEDMELRAWIAELGGPEGGRLSDLPITAERPTLEALVDLLSGFLFLVGPLHAALHFGQPDCLTVVPAWPAALFRAPPKAGEWVDAQRIAETLPPLPIALTQVLNNQIADYRYDRFGDYRGTRLGRLPAAQAAIQGLRRDLNEIEATLRGRGRGGEHAYQNLLPSRVPNSVNI